MRLLELEQLQPHEECIPERLSKLRKQIKNQGSIRQPILVDRNSGVILDGHHRYYALKELGREKIPAVEVDYRDDETVTVESGPGNPNDQLGKGDVIRIGLSDDVLPPKSTIHNYSIDYEGFNVSLETL